LRREFERFNEQLGGLFDGVDWDLEGNDDRHAPTAHFAIETLNVMADFSVCAKNTLGLVVSMAPAESYLDSLGPQGGYARVIAFLADKKWLVSLNGHALLELSAQMLHVSSFCMILTTLMTC
jgi:chitinase